MTSSASGCSRVAGWPTVKVGVAGARAFQGDGGGAVAVARSGDGDAEVGPEQAFRCGVVAAGHEVDAVAAEYALGEDGGSGSVDNEGVQLDFVG